MQFSIALIPLIAICILLFKLLSGFQATRSMRIGMIVIIVALSLGNMAMCVDLTNDLQTNNSQIETPQTKDHQECHGSNPDKCNGQCVNLDKDNQNCGRCGKACDPDETCHHGRCVSSNNNSKATCTDGKKNGKETDIDCGGSTCPPCADEKTCKISTDCSSGVCAVGFCQAPSCVDQVKNGGETGVDCGGPCKPCEMKPIGIRNITILPVQNNPPSSVPTYKFVIDTLIIDTTRSLQQDTDWASLGVSVNNQVFTPKTNFAGNLEPYANPIDLEVGPIPIPDDANVPVSIAYLIVNSGDAPGSPSNAEYIMDAATEALLLSYVSGSGSALEFANRHVGDLLTSYCDGTVVADKIVTNGNQLAEFWTANPGKKHREYPGHYHGTDSATGCGSNSDYQVSWTVERVS